MYGMCNLPVPLPKCAKQEPHSPRRTLSLQTLHAGNTPKVCDTWGYLPRGPQYNFTLNSLDLFLLMWYQISHCCPTRLTLLKFIVSSIYTDYVYCIRCKSLEQQPLLRQTLTQVINPWNEDAIVRINGRYCIVWCGESDVLHKVTQGFLAELACVLSSFNLETRLCELLSRPSCCLSSIPFVFSRCRCLNQSLALLARRGEEYFQFLEPFGACCFFNRALKAVG